MYSSWKVTIHNPENRWRSVFDGLSFCAVYEDAAVSTVDPGIVFFYRNACEILTKGKCFEADVCHAIGNNYADQIVTLLKCPSCDGLKMRLAFLFLALLTFFYMHAIMINMKINHVEVDLMKKLALLVLSLVLALSLIACTGEKEEESQSDAPMTDAHSTAETTDEETTADETDLKETTSAELTAEQTTEDELTAIEETTVEETTVEEDSFEDTVDTNETESEKETEMKTEKVTETETETEVIECEKHKFIDSHKDGEYKTYCKVCGKVADQKDVSCANKFVGGYYIARYDNLYFNDGQKFMTEYNERTGKYESFAHLTHLCTDSNNKTNAEGWIGVFTHYDAAGTKADNSGRYLVIRMRTTNGSRLMLQAKTGFNEAVQIERTYPINIGWETMVIDLSQFSSYETNKENATFWLRFRYFRSGAASPAHIMDISYAAIVDDLTEAAKIIGEGDINLYTDFAGEPEKYTLNSTACELGGVLGHRPTSSKCDETSSCKMCGMTLREAGDHFYTEMNVDKRFLASRATADEPARYYYSCACGAVGNESFASGKTLIEMIDTTKSERYDTIANGIVNGEKFMYFTDMHYVASGSNGTLSPGYDQHLDIMGAHFKNSGLTFALSGGDWLNNSNTTESALECLKDIDMRMQAAFGKSYYMVVGNHDYNYQIKPEGGGSVVSSQYKLTPEQISAVWYTDERYSGKTYYSFMGENTKFYVFDSGIDWGHTTTMDKYDEEQLTWFLSELEKNDDAHIAIAPHMYNVIDENDVHVMTAKALDAAKAYNDRGSYEFGGKTYDFSGKTGRVEFLIGGHQHYDYVDYYNGIPCVLVVNNGSSGSYPAFDMVAVDYDTRVIHTVRVGTYDISAAVKLDRLIALDESTAENAE